MQPYDERTAIYPVDPARTDLAREFRDNVRGPHGEDLRRVLHRMRSGPLAGKYVLVVRRPGREWVLGQLGPRRGDPVRIHEDQVFHSLDDAEWAVFKRRWQDLGQLPQECG